MSGHDEDAVGNAETPDGARGPTGLTWAERRAQHNLQKALARHPQHIDAYRRACASADPGDIEGWLHGLALLRKAQHSLQSVITAAKMLERLGIPAMLPGGPLEEACEELLEERRFLSHRGVIFRGDDLARARVAMAVDAPYTEPGEPIVIPIGETIFTYLFDDLM